MKKNKGNSSDFKNSEKFFCYFVFGQNKFPEMKEDYYSNCRRE